MNSAKLKDIKHTKIQFLYTNSEQSKKETKKTIPFTVTSKRIKSLGINLTKELKDLCTENFIILLKEIKDGTNIWKDVSFPWIRRLSVVKTSTLCKAICRFNAIPIKILLRI